MSKPPVLKRISYEDLAGLDSEVRKGITKLLGVLNPFLSNVTDGLNNRLTFVDNMACVIKSIEFTMPDVGEPLILDTYGTSFFSGRPTASARRLGNEVSLTGLLTHRSTDIAGFVQPIFALPKGFRPARPIILPITYASQPASIDINLPNIHLVYMGWSNTGVASDHIDLDNIRFTTDEDAPSFPAPFPLSVDVSSLTNKPITCQVLQITDLTSKTFKFSTMPNIAYAVENDNGIRKVKIYRAEGLTEGHKYKMTVMCTT